MQIRFTRSLVVSGVPVQAGTPLTIARKLVALSDDWVQEAIRYGHLGYVAEAEAQEEAPVDDGDAVSSAPAVQHRETELSTRKGTRQRPRGM